MKAVKARKDAIVKVSNEGVEQGLREEPNISVHVGHARFVGQKQVAVNDELLEAAQIFINVGAAPTYRRSPASTPYRTSPIPR